MRLFHNQCILTIDFYLIMCKTDVYHNYESFLEACYAYSSNKSSAYACMI